MASRYENTPIVSSPFRKGVLRGRELRKTPSLRFTFSTYQVKEDDRIDLLAARFLGDVTEWWRIADANPEVIDWMWLSPGMTLRIPDLAA